MARTTCSRSPRTLRGRGARSTSSTSRGCVDAAAPTDTQGADAAAPAWLGRDHLPRPAERAAHPPGGAQRPWRAPCAVRSAAERPVRHRVHRMGGRRARMRDARVLARRGLAAGAACAARAVAFVAGPLLRQGRAARESASYRCANARHHRLHRLRIATDDCVSAACADPCGRGTPRSSACGSRALLRSATRAASLPSPAR